MEWMTPLQELRAGVRPGEVEAARGVGTVPKVRGEAKRSQTEENKFAVSGQGRRAHMEIVVHTATKVKEGAKSVCAMTT